MHVLCSTKHSLPAISSITREADSTVIRCALLETSTVETRNTFCSPTSESLAATPTQTKGTQSHPLSAYVQWGSSLPKLDRNGDWSATYREHPRLIGGWYRERAGWLCLFSIVYRRAPPRLILPAFVCRHLKHHR